MTEKAYAQVPTGTGEPPEVYQSPVWGKWFFWDRLWQHRYGPFDTKDIADASKARVDTQIVMQNRQLYTGSIA